MKKLFHKPPLWVWLSVVSVIAVVVLLHRRYRSEQAASVSSGGGANPQLPRDTSIDAGVGTGGMFEHVPPTPTPVRSIISNEQWAINAINWLITKGYNASDADQAIRKYVSTQPVSGSQQSLVDLALGQFGAAPNLLPVGASASAHLLGYFKKTYAAVDARGLTFLGNAAEDQEFSTDPAIYAAYSDETVRWVPSTEWAGIISNNAGVPPQVQLLEATNAMWTQWQRIGLSAPAWVSPKGVTPYAVERPEVLPPAPDRSTLLPSQQIYKVGAPFSGNELFYLAQVVYGDGNKWPLIWNMNRDRIKDPNVLYEGQEIVIPKTGSIGAGIVGPYYNANYPGYNHGAVFESRLS